MYNLKLDDNNYLFICLYNNVTNTRQLKSKLLNNELNCCLVKTSLVCDPLQVAVSAYKAQSSYLSNELATKSLYTEILFNLNPSKNISQSLKKFGIDEEDDSLVLVVIGNAENLKNAQEQIEGDLVDLERLREWNDLKEIRKTYGWNEEVERVTGLVDFVVTRIATKHCL